MAGFGSISVEAGAPAVREFEIAWADGSTRDLSGIVPYFSASRADGTPLFAEVQGTASGNVVSLPLPLIATPGAYVAVLTLKTSGGVVANDGVWTGILEVNGAEPRALTTLAAVKSYLFGANADKNSKEDGLLADLINRASVWFEKQAGRSILQANYSEVVSGDGSRTFLPAITPLASVSAVTVDGVAIPARSAGVDGWVADTGMVTLAPALGASDTPLRFNRGILNVQVDYVAGFPVVPPDVEGCVCEMVALAYSYKNRVGVLNKSVGGETVGFQTLTLPVSVTSVIDAYRVYHL